jgi:hypothetical protein
MKQLVRCHVCLEDRIVLSWFEGAQDKTKRYFAHCAACGLQTGSFNTKEQLVKHWNERLTREKAINE